MCRRFSFNIRVKSLESNGHIVKGHFSEEYMSQEYKRLVDLVELHQSLRNRGINLLASENKLSPQVLQTLSSDLAGRYSSKFYGGSRYNREILSLVESMAKELFESEYAILAPISGHLCDLAVLNSLTSINDNVAMVPSEKGGYPFKLHAFQRNKVMLPFDENTMDFEYDKLDDFFSQHKPSLALIGNSAIPFPYDLEKISEVAKISNSDVVYDGSHVLGLIAGGEFQNPLKSEVKTLIGSTHKSFPGPQGGIILSNDEVEFQKISKQFSIQETPNPFEHGTTLVDNVHSNRIAALGVAIAEMLEFGKEYAQQTIKNSKYLSSKLDSLGFEILNRDGNFTESHQILIPQSPNDGREFKENLEKFDIFVDEFVRIGMSEVTRLGYQDSELSALADIFYEILKNDAGDENQIRYEIEKLISEHQELQYSFNGYEDIPI